MRLPKSGSPVGPDDSALIQACLQGDRSAWDTLVERYARLVYSVPRRYRLAPEDAEDVFQETFLVAYKALGQLKDHGRLSAWLITTAHRQCWRSCRRAARNPNTADLADTPELTEDEVERFERQHLVRQALTILGGKCEQLLTMMFLGQGEVSYQTIAEKLHMRIGSIGPTRARCVEKLETILETLGVFRDE
jgi:RNA polymerase sigma factor (sigma-70 family)